MFHKYNFRFQPGEISMLSGVLAGASGTILGFLITAIALMASVMDRDLLKNLRATGGTGSLSPGALYVHSFFSAPCVISVLIASMVRREATSLAPERIHRVSGGNTACEYGRGFLPNHYVDK